MPLKAQYWICWDSNVVSVCGSPCDIHIPRHRSHRIHGPSTQPLRGFAQGHSTRQIGRSPPKRTTTMSEAWACRRPSRMVAIAERSSNLFWTKFRLIAALCAAETERSGGQKGRGLGGRNFCLPSLSDSDFSAAEFRASETGTPLGFYILWHQS
jgi:hypothetical protein